MANTQTFRVRGMHCPACEFLVGDEVSLDPSVVSAQANLAEGTLRVELRESPADADALLVRWNTRLDPLGYRLYGEHQDVARETRKETWAGLGLGLGFLALFGSLEASGLVHLLAPDSLSLPGSFLLGLLASVSSCFALVGGLLVSYTAAVGRRDPSAIGWGLTGFHLARLGVFFVGGGFLGLAGSALSASVDFQRTFLTLAAVVMAGLGLSLLGLRWPGRRSVRALGHARRFATWGTWGGGIALGSLTFFLPCGFTQSVQFQALSSGSFFDGATLTLAFALGTFPVLASVSWLLGKGLAGRNRAILLKAGGTVILGLGAYQLWGALHLWGLRF